MVFKGSFQALTSGCDCRAAFRAAYENRYTWDTNFSGYKGRCLWIMWGRTVEGIFQVGSDLRPSTNGVSDDSIDKAFLSQLREVAIHRVRRGFDATHGENTFTAGNISDVGIEVIVGGKNAGDRYRIKNDVVTMVYRHIHGSLITIFTQEVVNTGNGYLSKSYTSQYKDPKTGENIGTKTQFTDSFQPVTSDGPWVLRERIVEKDSSKDLEVFKFLDMKPL